MAEQKESVRLLKKVETDLSASHLRLLFALDKVAEENSGETVEGKILENMRDLANAITATNHALQRVRAVLGENEKAGPVERTKEAGAV